MLSVPEATAGDVANARADDIEAREAAYRAAVAANPDDVGATVALAWLLHGRDQTEAALRLVERALPTAPGEARLHLARGAFLLALGGPAEAAEAFRAAAALRPEIGVAHLALARILRDKDGIEEAFDALSRAIAADSAAPSAAAGDGALPEYDLLRGELLFPACMELGNACMREKRTQQALDFYGFAQRARPASATANRAVGRTLYEMRRYADAEPYFRRAVAAKPDYDSAWLSLGNIGRALGRPEEALESYRRAVGARPDLADAHYGVGLILNDLGRDDEAVEALCEALRLRPDYFSALHLLGMTLRRRGNIDDSIDCFRRAIALRPNSADAHWALSMALLLKGDAREGWKEYEWRWRLDSHISRSKPRNERYPRWRGEPLAGKTILVWGEQGVGDEIMFLGLLAELRVRGPARIVVEGIAKLQPLFARSFPWASVYGYFEPQDARVHGHPIDFQVPMGSLPHLLRGEASAFAPVPPHLVADPELVAAIRARYRRGDDLLVGIAWLTKSDDGMGRTIDLTAWAPVLKTPGVRFVNLQYGDTAAEIAAAREATGVDVLSDASIDSWDRLDDYAAQIAALDLVISIDNSTLHLAGALGRPVWGLLNARVNYRWSVTGETTPWYPSARLVRQAMGEPWSQVVERVATDLGRMVSARKGG